MSDPKDFSRTAANNTSVGGVNIAEGAATADMNNSQREITATFGTLDGSADFGSFDPAILIDHIGESTLDAGVTIDGLLIKDGGLPNLQIYTQPVGIMAPYGGDTAPALWLLCDGAAVSRTTYADLFAALGEKYGAGDGSTTFNLPDKRDRASVGAGTAYSVGDTGGAATVTLDQTELPDVRLYTIVNQNTVEGDPITSPTTSPVRQNQGVDSFNYELHSNTNEPTHGRTSALGSGAAHENMPPFEADNWIIYAGV